MGFLETYGQLQTPEEKNELLLKWITQQPHDLFSELRQDAPIFAAPSCLIVSRYDDVKEVLTDQDFSVEPYRQGGGGTFVLGMDDGPERDRALAILKLVVKRTDLERIRAIVVEEAKALIGHASPQVPFDIVGQFGRLIPLRVAARYFGVPGPDANSLSNWIFALSRAFIYGYSTQHFIQDPAVEQEAAQARKDYGTYVNFLVTKTLSERQAGAPDKDDVLGRLLTMQRAPATAFTIPEVIRNLMGLVNGMIENINAAVTNVMYVLLSLPEAERQAAVVAAQNDNRELLLRYVSEALRLEAPVPFLARECLRDHILAKGTPRETRIPQGKRILAAIYSAGRDKTGIDKPEAFLPGRTDYQPLHFGVGLHECLGKYISQVQIVEMVKSLLVLSGLRIASDVAKAPVYDKRSFFPTSFHLTFDRTRSDPPAPPPVQSALTAIMTIKSPEDYHALKALLEKVYPNIAQALGEVGTVHFARFVFLENNTKLAIITSYDGSFETYINDFIEQVGELFDRMLEHMQGAPRRPVRKHRQEFIEYVRSVDVKPAVPFYIAYPALTVQNILFQEAHADE